MIDMLIEAADVDIDAQDNIGDTATHTACWNGDTGVLALARLITAGANLELTDNIGETPLHRSLYDNNCEVTELLLGAGANVHVRNNDGRTPCHTASTFTRFTARVVGIWCKIGRAGQRRRDTATAS